MVSVNLDVLLKWVEEFFIPLSRILGFISVAPLFGHRSITMIVKALVGLALAATVVPALPSLPRVDIVSVQGALVIFQQSLIGLAIGLMMQVTFVAIDLAGQACGLSMGFGFASFFDPSSGTNQTVISTLFGILAMLVFLSLDGHLLMISALIESFYTLPVNTESFHFDYLAIARWGGQLFVFGLQLALPIVVTLLITNVALGVLTRAAPQLNIFGIGFPITILAGLVITTIVLPSLANPVRHIFEQGIHAVNQIMQWR